MHGSGGILNKKYYNCIRVFHIQYLTDTLIPIIFVRLNLRKWEAILFKS